MAQSGPALEQHGHEMNDQVLPDWLAWKKYCALKRCAPKVQSALREYVWHQVQNLLAPLKLPIEALVGPATESVRRGGSEITTCYSKRADTLWAYFENRALAGTHASGKCYKEWIFAHAAGKPDDGYALRAILSGVKMQLDMVLRGVLVDEFTFREERRKGRIDEIPSPEPPDDNKSRPSWIEDVARKAEDLLGPNPSGVITPQEQADYKGIAESLAEELWGMFSRRDKIVLWATLNDIPLDNIKITKAAGRQKSQLYACWGSIEKMIAENIIQYHQDAPGNEYLHPAVLDNLLMKANIWVKSEKLLGAGFSKVRSK